MAKPDHDNPWQATWDGVESYVAGLLGAVDPVLTSALATSTDAGLPSIAVSPVEGKLLHLLAKAIGARKILEIGTLGGYSTIWLARALPNDGRLITLEVDPAHAAVARTNFSAAGLDEIIDLRLGAALETLPQIYERGEGPFDMVFIDADKQSTPEYFEWALKLTHPGSLIIVDNVIRDGKVIDSESDDPRVQAMRRFFERLSTEPRVSATVLQTVGSKGYDGFAIAVVTK